MKTTLNKISEHTPDWVDIRHECYSLSICIDKQVSDDIYFTNTSKLAEVFKCIERLAKHPFLNGKISEPRLFILPEDTSEYWQLELEAEEFGKQTLSLHTKDKRIFLILAKILSKDQTPVAKISKWARIRYTYKNNKLWRSFSEMPYCDGPTDWE